MLTNLELREHLRLPPDKDAEVEALRTSVIDMFEVETHGLWNARTGYVEEVLLRTDRVTTIPLRLRPVSSVTLVEQRTLTDAEFTAAEAGDFVLEEGARIRWLSGYFLRSVRVTYTGGWSSTTVPSSVKRALIVQARFSLARTMGENLITSSQAVENAGSTILLKPDLHPLFAKSCEQWKRLT